jgi:hypothetical protein
MNWYNKFLRLAYKNRFDTIAIDLCKDIFQDIRILYYSKNISHNVFRYRNQRLEEIITEILARRNKPSKPINIIVVARKIDGFRLRFDTFDMDGRTLDSEDNYTIDVEIYIKSNFDMKNFLKIYNFLLNVIRHEIQHVMDAANGQDINTGAVLELPYFLREAELAAGHMVAPAEIVPCIRGIMLGAKKQHLPFSDALKRTIRENFYSNDPVHEEQLKSSNFADQFIQIENNTYNTIMDRARVIFPELY